MTPEEVERKHQENLRQIAEFRLMDDEFMTRYFDGNPKYIEFVLRILLEEPGLRVIHVQTQMFVENLVNRSVRLDVVATDSAGRRMNVEIQRSDKGAGRRRARYNSSMLDVSLLEKGKDFDDLPEVWVIFITERDVMGQGRALYRIERRDADTGDAFDDGSHILYVNGAYRGDTPVGKLMHDFACRNAADMYYETLAERARFLKESSKGVVVMSKAMEEIRRQEHQEGRREGRREGKEEHTKEVALRMLNAGTYALKEISEMSGMPLDALQALSAEASL